MDAMADTRNGELTESRSFVVSEEAALYEAPSETSAVVLTLPVGSEIIRLAALDVEHASDGILSTWMQGTCELGGDTFHGYIPRSWLALTWQELGPDTLLLFGVAGRNPVYWHYTGVVKVVSDGRMLWGMVFSTPDIDMGSWENHGSDVSSEPLDPSGLSGVEDLILLSFTGDTHCDRESDRCKLIAWTGWCLAAGISVARVVEGGVVLLEQEILLPGTAPFRANLVGVVSTSQQYDQEASAYIISNADTTTWTWTGSEFIEHWY